MRLLFIALLLFEVHAEVTKGYSLTGCFMRGFYGIDKGVCGGATFP